MLVYEKCIQKFRSSYAFTMLCQQLCGNLKLHKCIWLKICCTSTWSSLAVTGCWWHHVCSRVTSGTTNTPFNTWFISNEILCIKWTVNVGYLLGVSWITLLGFHCMYHGCTVLILGLSWLSCSLLDSLLGSSWIEEWKHPVMLGGDSILWPSVVWFLSLGTI